MTLVPVESRHFPKGTVYINPDKVVSVSHNPESDCTVIRTDDGVGFHTDEAPEAVAARLSPGVTR